MHRFFISPEWLRGGQIAIKGYLVHQLRNVLRLKAGDRIMLLDNSGWEYEVELRSLTREQVEGTVKDQKLCPGEPRLRLTLYAALLKGDKFEWVLQKGTELGVTDFVPLLCERGIAARDAKMAGSKEARWERIILEAAEQSGRGKLPLMHPATPFPQACKEAEGISLLFWEGEGGRGLREALGGRAGEATAINIFVGSEGGFSSQEVALASSCGITPVTLGRRVLRAETAGLVAAATVLYECGELGG